MKNCPKCKNEHNNKGLFCSRSCANSRVFSEETKRLKSIKNKEYRRKNPETVKIHYETVWTDAAREQARQKSINNHKKIFEKKLLNTPWNKMKNTMRRKVILEEQNGCCNKCHLSEWFGKKLTLELEHRDGNSQNNDRENLEFLCPNCHSLTETWRGRNNKRIKKVSDEELLNAVNESTNIAQALIKLGMAPKGRNYNRVLRLLGKSL